MRARHCTFALVGALLVTGALAHVRLRHPSNSNPLFWSNPASISVVIHSVGSDDLPDGSHTTALRNAIAAWNGLTGTSARLVENASPAQQARSDWWSDDIHLLIFDEDDSSGYFPLGSGTVALTPIWFFSNGVIIDADVLFNGRGFSFTTSGEPGRFDVQDVAAHELGHLIGLDHSGWAGATMYPYVSPSMILHRSLSDDELRGMRDAYPQGTFGVLRGRIERSSNSTSVAGAHVVARDADGRTRAAGLTTTTGAFELRGLDAGTYEVYAHPLVQPVGAANLGTGWTVHTDFAYTVFGSHGLAAGQNLDLGDLAVLPAVALDLGRSADSLPLRGVANGAPHARSLRGAGLVAGSTLVASDPAVSVGAVVWAGTQVFFQLTVPQGTAIGHVDLVVIEPGGDEAVLPAAIEITPPDPVVTLVSPNQGSAGGGTLVTLSGSNFHPGARIVIGDRIYVDGAGATVLGANTIELTTVATSPGTFDVVVIDASGVEGRAAAGYQFSSAPALGVVFPSAGSDTGGTDVTLTGSGFLPGLTVTIDGVQQPAVAVESATRAHVTTIAGVTGGPYVLEAMNSDGGSAQALFSYVATADPTVGAVTPASGPTAGGTTVTVEGQDFVEGLEVWFGADPSTGQGGVQASSVTFIDANTLSVVLPARPAGATSVLVRDGTSGQAGVRSAAFTYVAPAGGGGGGGGCYTVPVDGPRDPGEAARALAALLLLVLAVRLVSRGPRTVRVRS